MKRIAILMAALALVATSCCNKCCKKKCCEQKEIAVQLYSLRSLIGAFGNGASDYAAVLDSLKAMGYTAVEAASYGDGKLYGKDPAEFKADVDKAGLKLISSHVGHTLSADELKSGDFSESLAWWDECIACHKAAGVTYLVMPWMPVPETLADLDTYCKYFNEIGKRCSEAGIAFGYHNHAHEFTKIGDEMMYDYMLKHTDPALVFFQMDVYWTVIGKQSPVEYFKTYPGRFRVLHIKDEKEIGQSGMLGFDSIFANAKTAGVESIVVEVERYSYDDVYRSIRESIDYLKKAPFVPAKYE